jgi:hypothetical protein
MTALKWDTIGERYYETGVQKAVLYPASSTGTYPKGVAWNGITAFTEKPTGADETKLYADNIKYLGLRAVEEFEATIEAYTYPDEFAECDGSAELTAGVSIGQQPRKTFGLCTRTEFGNDTDGTNHGYKLHLIWGATASPSERAYETINDSPDAIKFSWDISTTPVEVEGYSNTASMVIDSTKCDKAKLALLEKQLYGDADTEPNLPMPDEILTIMKTQ